MENIHALSWQTNILTFKNQSLYQIRQRLEKYYDAEVILFNELYKKIRSKVRYKGKGKDEKLEEIRLILYMNYDLLKNRLTIRGLPV